VGGESTVPGLQRLHETIQGVVKLAHQAWLAELTNPMGWLQCTVSVIVPLRKAFLMSSWWNPMDGESAGGPGVGGCAHGGNGCPALGQGEGMAGRGNHGRLEGLALSNQVPGSRNGNVVHGTLLKLGFNTTETRLFPRFRNRTNVPGTRNVATFPVSGY
jgi:hypothetical protein